MRFSIAATLIAVFLAGSANAQEISSPVAEFAAGVLMFPDEGVVTEGFAGGAGRFYLSPRISVGPEVAFINGDNHSHVMVTGNMTFDVLGPDRPVTPFVVVGGGLFHTSEKFPNNTVSTHDEGSFTAGGGLRALLGKRVVGGIEARVGWETHIRLNGFIGFHFGD